MKHPLIPFILLIFISFGILGTYSFVDYTIKIGDIDIQKTEIKKFVLGDTIPLVGKKIAVSDTNKVIIHREEMDTTAQRILLIGDSMLEGLMLRLRDYVEQNGHSMKTVIWYSSSTLWYGTSDTLSYFINQYKPTYIMLVLGANELFVGDIINKRTRYTKNVIAQMKNHRFVWIGPPNWKDDTGINEMIIDNVGEDRYFPSKNLKYRRYSDGAHPTKQSALMWMDSIAVWVMRDSRYPIRLKYPEKRSKRSPNTTILQPKK